MNRDDSMEATISALLEEDTQAQEQLRTIQHKRQQMADTLAQKKEDIQRDKTADAQKQIDGIREQYQLKYDQETEQLAVSSQNSLADLLENFSLHRAEWVDTLVARCLE